jgi:hypothetical protein
MPSVSFHLAPTHTTAHRARLPSPACHHPHTRPHAGITCAALMTASPAGRDYRHRRFSSPPAGHLHTVPTGHLHDWPLTSMPDSSTLVGLLYFGVLHTALPPPTLDHPPHRPPTPPLPHLICLRMENSNSLMIENSSNSEPTKSCA